MYERLNQPDSALAHYERLVTGHDLQRIFTSDASYLAATYKRLGELYEARGERAKATDYYTRFVELWRNADPELEPAVQDVRGRIARLAGER